ncbi:MAG: porphobilinogen synthase [Planctomycetes bacterium]|nr:porphobilinogen synthase [Planctomycetota bacterium]
MFPTHRSRRLRNTTALRNMLRETTLAPQHLIAPLFVQEGLASSTPIASMPGQSRHGLDSLLREAEACAEAGVGGVILFGLPEHKEPEGSGAWAEDGIVQQAARAIRARELPLLLMGDVCLCEYTSHGHCGQIQPGDREGRVDNDATLALLARTAVSQARAGIEVIAPSDMMDGRVAAIRAALDEAGFTHTPILSYAAKFASAFYGPFRDAADSAPAFGDRRTYQMDPANGREALRDALLDVEEGADMLMVKPGLAYLDILVRLRQACDLPLAAYCVSGEYAMLEFAAAAGAIDKRAAVLEALTSLRRAGADSILTYHAREAAAWLRE